MWKAENLWLNPPKKISYKFGKLRSSTFQKALDDFCVILGFHFIDERVPNFFIFFQFKMAKCR